MAIVADVNNEAHPLLGFPEAALHGTSVEHDCRFRGYPALPRDHIALRLPRVSMPGTTALPPAQYVALGETEGGLHAKALTASPPLYTLYNTTSTMLYITYNTRPGTPTP